MGFEVIKYYDACCDQCGNWYGSEFKPYNGANKNEAIAEMKKDGWRYIKGKTLCQYCANGERGISEESR
ncbi:hypothetical protein P8825_14905 [Shouchella clausii]|uniref:hypothetical protein n=1 Tax=Shouchella clausii TaxID=79880 RepID=UPI002DB7CBA0|nr:hypothetical protein [Shouchella clausii]MEB5480853.1 hypothetical protein [Shouchella clausii]